VSVNVFSQEGTDQTEVWGEVSVNVFSQEGTGQTEVWGGSNS